MNLIWFAFGAVSMAALFLAGITVMLLVRGRKPPDRDRRQDFERQFGNLMRYDGSSRGQKEREDDGDD
jgi:hypothetical protein